MKKIYLYPLWLRIWHWFNALLFLILILSGISLHYSDTPGFIIPFDISMMSHNICGILLSLIYLIYVIFNIITGNYKYYIPHIKGILKRFFLQAKFYLMGIFINEPHPYFSSEKEKFNPLQQIAYFFIMFLFMPIIILSGWFLLFPEFSPEQIFGMGGVWPMALAHIVIGYALSLFMFVHIYLGTTGKTISELFKSMFTGWHLAEEDEKGVPEIVSWRSYFASRKSLFPVIFYNSLTLGGAFMSTVCFLIIVGLIIYDLLATYPNPYLGIITFVVLPSFLLAGIIIMIIGIFRENRKVISIEQKEKKLPVIDFNKPKHQVAFLFASVGTLTLALLTVFGTFKAYEYTDSDDFCGNICHKVMESEYTAYQLSSHSRVGCVKCHIGPGAGWFVKSKLSGLYQVYSVLLNKYPRPVPTPIANLRPAQETCEQCHDPRHFYNEKKVSYDYYLSDEHNTKSSLTMLIKVGGGNPELGNNNGIHWSMNIANEITYFASDRERMNIDWVRSKNIATGKVTIYRKLESKIPDEKITPDKLRKMDCIDCHNRPSHQFSQPNKIVNLFMSINRIDNTLPFIKNLSVQAMESNVSSKNTAYNDIRNFIIKFYSENYPEIASSKKASIETSVENIFNIYKRNYFPDMNVSWKKFPNNIGHLYSPGCFRCHDGKHIADDGKVITKECKACHTVVTQEISNETKIGFEPGFEFIHPGGTEKMIKEQPCTNCHGVKEK